MPTTTAPHNYPTLTMCYYGFNENRARGQASLDLQQFYVRCGTDEEFKASYAPFLDLEYVTSEELRAGQPAPVPAPIDFCI